MLHTERCFKSGVCAPQKRMRRSQHARKETEFLRLKRTRLGLEDFESLKVIGRGAFGEVKTFLPKHVDQGSCCHITVFHIMQICKTLLNCISVVQVCVLYVRCNM